MNLNTLISAFTNRRSNNKSNSGTITSGTNDISYKSKYEQRRISNRLFK